MGSRRTHSGAERVYEAARLWVDRALRVDDSLFTPGKPIWSSRWLTELRGRFLDNPDESTASFLNKFKGQLEHGAPEIYQLAAEALYVHFLIVSAKDSTEEQRVIDTVLAWSPDRVAIPPDLVAGLTPGIANPGQNFHAGRPFQTGFLIEFAEQWKEQEPDKQHRLLANPWEFKRFATALEFRSVTLQGNPNRPRAQRDAMFHLVFPDTISRRLRIPSIANTRIAKAFSNLSHTTNGRRRPPIKANPPRA